MQALKGLVVGLGLLIVIGIVLLGYAFFVKLSGSDVKLVKDTANAVDTIDTASSPSTGFGESRIDLPAGCSVTEMRPAGNRLYVRTGPTGLCERIIVIDAGTGGVLGTIHIRP